ncbi:MAG: hypothetical protein U0S36_04535 [Candidatus Nanopelagicales bacterium]
MSDGPYGAEAYGDALGGRPSRFPLLGAVLTVVLITVTGLAILVWVSVTLAYGSGSPWLPALALAVVPALLIAGAARMVFTAVLPRPPSYARVALVSWVVIAAVAGVSVQLASAAYDESTATAAAACSAEDSAVLRSIVLGPVVAEDPVGRRDGSCALAIPVSGDRDSAQSQLITAMAQAGFSEQGNDLATRTFVRDDLTVVALVGLTGEDDVTDVTLTIPAG